MRGTCAACGYTSGLEGFASDPEWREAVLAAASLPSNLGLLVVRYVGLFRPGKRALTPARCARLFRDMVELLTQADTTYKQRTAHIPNQVWQQALQSVLDAPDLQRPLKNHNYLLTIAFTQLSKRTDAAQNQRGEERKHVARTHSTGMQPVGNALSDAPPTIDLPSQPDAYRRLYKQAEQAIRSDGVLEGWIIKPLVEARMRQMIIEADHD